MDCFTSLNLLKFSLKNFVQIDTNFSNALSHYQSEIIRWFFEKLYKMTDMKFKDYLIWSRKK